MSTAAAARPSFTTASNRIDEGANDVHIGRHRVWRQPSDVVHLIIDGDISAQEILLIFEQYRLAAREHGYVLVIADASGLGTVSADARRALGGGSSIPMRGTVIHSTSFHARIIARLVAGVMSLFTPTDDHPVVFLPGEAEAHAWIKARRAYLSAVA